MMAVRQYNLTFVYSALDRDILRGGAMKTAEARDVVFTLCLLGLEQWAQDQHAHQPGTIRQDPNDFVLVVVDDNETDAALKIRGRYRWQRWGT
jgi:hypothetical protein